MVVRRLKCGELRNRIIGKEKSIMCSSLGRLITDVGMSA